MAAPNVNIDWGGGKISRGDWRNIKKILLDYNIRTLLEFGSGLSTEMFDLEPQLERIVSLDVLEWHIERMKVALPRVQFIQYSPEKVPKIDEKFDMVFVDGPAGRFYELTAANKLATKVIYCHDWGRGQDLVMLDKKWKVISKNKVFACI